MTTLKNRPHTALLVIDVQNDVVAQAHNRDGVIANIALLVDKARAEDVPVVWVQHSGNDLPEGMASLDVAIATLELHGVVGHAPVQELYGDPALERLVEGAVDS